MAKPGPVTLDPITSTAPVPSFTKKTGSEFLEPTLTSPKSVLAGVTSSKRVIPVPARETVVGELVASLAIEMLPANRQDKVGANVALNVTLWPAANVKGSGSALILKPAPLTLARETVTASVPALVKVTV
jgi:hypothetical protein